MDKELKRLIARARRQLIENRDSPERFDVNVNADRTVTVVFRDFHQANACRSRAHYHRQWRAR
jgi:hypothetical protein